MLASPYYGSSGKVVEIDMKQSRVRVQLHVPQQPDIASIINQHEVNFLNNNYNNNNNNNNNNNIKFFLAHLKNSMRLHCYIYIEKVNYLKPIKCFI